MIAPVFKLNMGFEELREYWGLTSLANFQKVVEKKIDFKSIDKLVADKVAFLGAKDQYVNLESKDFLDESWRIKIWEEK